MNYEQKYLKYKEKYINLKQKGGVPNEKLLPSQPLSFDFLIVSHNGRMRCFIDSLKPVDLNIIKSNLTSFNNQQKEKNLKEEKEIRFMNGAILKVTLNEKSNDGKITLFYTGEVKQENRKGIYFVKELSINPLDIVFGTYKFDYKASFGIDQLPSTVNFYIVRHGEGTHNVASTGTKIFNQIRRAGKDPVLTTDGETQAIQAGEALSKINLKEVFVSKLKRTIQTAYLILKKRLALNNDTIKENTHFIVLPCSHELEYKENSNCDDNASTFFMRATENISNCESTNNDDKCTQFSMTYNDPNNPPVITIKDSYTQKNIKEVNDTPVLVNWNFYNNFYKNKNKQDCAKTNMIKEAVDILKDLKIIK
jgi:broad specificity phosphatase PhoE